ncbi:MAG: hypothetical protein V4549_18160 [Bacteroidota bacterium]
MIADEIQEMDKSGKLKRFLKAGVIPVKVKFHYDIFRNYQAELEANKECKDCIMISVSNTATIFSVHDNTVRNAIKSMTA